MAVFDKSVADVSFLAGMLVDKFTYHLPLYRQHQGGAVRKAQIFVAFMGASNYTFAEATWTQGLEDMRGSLPVVIYSYTTCVSTTQVEPARETLTTSGSTVLIPHPDDIVFAEI